MSTVSSWVLWACTAKNITYNIYINKKSGFFLHKMHTNPTYKMHKKKYTNYFDTHRYIYD